MAAGALTKSDEGYNQTNSVLRGLHLLRLERNHSNRIQRTFNVRGKIVTIYEQPGAALGSHIWVSSTVLSKYFSEELSTEFQNQTVLELGAGTGLVGITCNLLGARVTLTDQKPVLALLQENVRKNCVDNYTVQELNWGLESPTTYVKPGFDYIVAADVVYKEELFQPLIDTFKTLSEDHTIIYLAYKQRSAAEDKFFDLLAQDFDRLMATRIISEGDDVVVFRVVPKRRSYLFRSMEKSSAVHQTSPTATREATQKLFFK